MPLSPQDELHQWSKGVCSLRTIQITHLLYFKDTKGMKKFFKTVKKGGFMPEMDSVELNGDGYYTCLINHTEAVELPIINSVTDYLITIAEKYEGIYDGWETSIIK